MAPPLAESPGCPVKPVGQGLTQGGGAVDSQPFGGGVELGGLFGIRGLEHEPGPESRSAPTATGHPPTASSARWTGIDQAR